MTMKKWFRGASDYQVRVVVAVAIAILGFALWSAVGYFMTAEIAAPAAISNSRPSVDKCGRVFDLI